MKGLLTLQYPLLLLSACAIECDLFPPRRFSTSRLPAAGAPRATTRRVHTYPSYGRRTRPHDAEGGGGSAIRANHERECSISWGEDRHSKRVQGRAGSAQRKGGGAAGSGFGNQRGRGGHEFKGGGEGKARRQRQFANAESMCDALPRLRFRAVRLPRQCVLAGQWAG